MFKRITAVLITLTIILFQIGASCAADSGFTDVPDGYWAKAEIERFAARGIVGGVGKGTFAPGKGVTREQFAKMLVLTFKKDLKTSARPSFSDVPAKRWSYKYVETCGDLLNSYGKSAFHPGEYATREDIAVALVKMLELTECTDNSEKFSDTAEISADKLKYIQIAAEKGLINGYADGTFRPKNGITRAETVVLLNRAAKQQVIATVGGQNITLENFSYSLIQSCAYYEQMGYDLKSNLDQTVTEQLKKEAMQSFIIFAATDKLAADNKLTVTDADEASLIDLKEKKAESIGGTDALRKQLESYGISEEYYDYINRYNFLYSKLYDNLFASGKPLAPSEDTIISTIMKDYVRAKHILIQTSADAADYAVKKKKAEDILQQAKAGKNFDALIKEFNEDPGMREETDGYVFTKGTMVKEFEDAAFALKANEVSDLVNSSYGIHIIKRLPLTEDFIKTNIEKYSEEFLQKAMQDKLNELAANIEVMYADAYNKLDIADILA